MADQDTTQVPMAPTPDASPAATAPDTNALGLTYEQTAALRDQGHIDDTLFTKLYPGQGSGGGDTSAPSPQTDIVSAQDLDNARAAGQRTHEVLGNVWDSLKSGTLVQPGQTLARSPEDVPQNVAPATTPAAQPTAAAPGAAQNGGAGQVQLASDSAGQVGQDAARDGFWQYLQPNFGGINQQEAGIKMAADAGMAKAKEQAAYLDTTQQADQKRIQDQETRQAQQNAFMDDQRAKVSKAADTLAGAHVDPNRLYKNMDTGDKVLAGIGLFLGAFGSGGNKAVGVIQNAIERDIDAQKADIGIKRDSFNAQQGIYHDMMNQFHDESAATNATRLAYLNNAQLKVQQLASKYAAPEIQGKAQELMGQLEQSKSNAMQQFGMSMLQRMPVDPNTNPAFLDKDRGERFVPGYGLAADADSAKTMRTTVAAANNLKTSLSSLNRIASMPGKSLSPTDKAQAAVQVTSMLGPMKDLFVSSGARFSNVEEELMAKLAKDPTAIFSLDSYNKAILQALGQKVDQAVQSRANAYGFRTASQRLGAVSRK